MNRILIIISLMFLSYSFLAQDNVVWLNPNMGQWDDRILYKVDLEMGEMLIENDGFTYNLNNFKELMSHSNFDEKKVHRSKKGVRKQIIKTKFIESTWKGNKEEKQNSNFYRNYFIGEDSTKWKSKVKSVASIVLNDFYPDIDLIIDGRDSKLQYSFLLKKNTKSSKIKYKITGASSLKLKEDGSLAIGNRFGEIIESRPVAWNIINNKKVYVEVNFVLNGSIISFDFPDDYDHSSPLMIDPSISFSTFSGSTADNWGMTATPDNYGNLYAAGIVFNDGGEYPVTSGVFDEEINGGEINPFVSYTTYGFDLAISKFNKDGSELLHATYLGGTGNETPHSLVVDENDNLYLLGATSSTNFPILINSFDSSFNGGTPEINNYLYFSASDLFISKLSSDGSQLLGSTYLGGSGNDGLNRGDLNYNFGDAFRGEVIHGNDGYVYVSSTTRSNDFPTLSPIQNSLRGDQDAVVFKIKDDLSALAWSSYFGGEREETGNSIQKSINGDVYFTGCTTSDDILNFNGEEEGYLGGLSDGYLIRLNANSGNVINSTYVGSAGYDQVYFVQLDQSNNVYVYGQTDTEWTISSGLYGTPNSGQFIRKYNPSLTSIEWTTMIGAGTGYPEISPTAFLVSNCNDIFLAGWGGVLNRSNRAINSTTNGFETTPDAFQTQTNGSNFYIAVLEKDATELKYGTFMGGFESSSNHVDGGTSRFDKNGKVYHAVCAACGGNENGFTSTPNVYSSTNQSRNCNLAAFKIELNSVQVDGTSVAPDLCLNAPNVFLGVSSNGNSFYWDFGDGNYSNEQSPSHTYSQSGSYTISLTVSDTISCLSSKTKTFDVRVLDLKIGHDEIDSLYCPNVDYELSAYGGDSYLWSPVGLFSNPSDSVTEVNIFQDTTIQLVIKNFCIQDSFSFDLYTSNIKPLISDDTILCENQSVQLIIENSLSQVWSPSTYLDDSLSSTPIASPLVSIQYKVEIVSNDGCFFNDSLTVEVRSQEINSVIPEYLKNTSLCIGSTFSVPIENSLWHQWKPSSVVNDSLSLNPVINLDTSTTIYITSKTIDYCYITDSIVVNVFKDVPSPVLYSDTLTNCIGDSTYLKFSGAEFYDYSLNSNYLLFAKDSLSTILSQPGYFYCDFVNACGSYLDSVYIDLIAPNMLVSNDTILCSGQNIVLTADNMELYHWYEDGSFVSDSSRYSTNPNVNTIYKVIGEDFFGCIDSSQIIVKVFDTPKIRIMDDYLAQWDEEIFINVYTENYGDFDWFPKEFLTCTNCMEPVAKPNKEIVYKAVFTDTNGCKTEDDIRIYYDGQLYVPNSFTPDVDGKVNTLFQAKGINITNFQMLIFDRWGRVVFESNSISEKWDGTFKGEACQFGTYVWKIFYKDVSGESKQVFGHVNLLR